MGSEQELKKILSHLSNAFFDVSKYIWDVENDSLMAPKEPIRIANAYRRTIILFCYLLQREGIIVDIFSGYPKGTALAYDSKYHVKNKVYGDRLFYPEDTSYTKLVHRMFRLYGWDFPQEYQWNYYNSAEEVMKTCYMRDLLLHFIDNNIYSLDDMLKEYQYYEIAQEEKTDIYEAVKDNALEFYAEKIALVSFHCKLLDQIEYIYKKAVRDNNMGDITADYLKVHRLVDGITDCISDNAILVDQIEVKSNDDIPNILFQKGYIYHSGDGNYYDEMDMFVLTKPDIFVLLPIFKDCAKSFMEKWT